ncbi:MAG: TonB-dependent receptor, partial [Deltaproteobacteria bacterium]|nr:TonB-dependent receptor [Deltaproteobacteria bacterium]
RYDNYSDFGDTINPRAALVWQAHRDLTTKLLYGTAFRAPSFSELKQTMEHNGPPGGPRLKPETIQTLELAFDYRFNSRLRTGLNLFGYDADGLIERVPDANNNVYLRNALDLQGHGIELEAEWKITDTLKIRGNFSYQHSEDKNTGIRTPDVPGRKLYLNPHWTFWPDWSIDAQLFWIGDRTRPGQELDDYTVVNLTLRRKNIARHWDVALGARNLFDEDAYDPSALSRYTDYPLPGRSIFAEIRYNF